jgi:hypothetical protein
LPAISGPSPTVAGGTLSVVCAGGLLAIPAGLLPAPASRLPSVSGGQPSPAAAGLPLRSVPGGPAPGAAATAAAGGGWAPAAAAGAISSLASRAAGAHVSRRPGATPGAVSVRAAIRDGALKTRVAQDLARPARDLCRVLGNRRCRPGGGGKSQGESERRAARQPAADQSNTEVRLDTSRPSRTLRSR